MRILQRFLVGSILLAGCGGTVKRESRFLADGFLNIAHRGGAMLAPEETLAAFDKAILSGADILELDLHSTADGVIVVSHDATLDRTTDGSGKIRSLTLEQIRKFDAGYGFTPDRGKTYPYRGKGIVIPTFEEVLEAHPGRYFVLEIKQRKPSIVKEVLRILMKADAQDRMLLASSRDKVIAEIRETYPGAITSFATLEVLTFMRLKGDAEQEYTPPGRVLQVPAWAISRKFLEKARRFGLKVHAWTVNDPAEMKRLIDLGVDGIITDHPLRLRRILERE